MTSIELPESVHRYCVDERVRAAVDLLLVGKGPKVPATLRWDELDDFYAACMAAQRTRIDWARALLGIWNPVWSDLLPRWRASGPLEQLRDSDLSVAPLAVWQEGTFTRDHRRNGFYADPYVELDVERGVRVGIGLFQDGEPLVGEVRTPWSPTDDEEYVASSWLPFGVSPALDLSDVKDEAREVVRALDDRVDRPA